MKGNKIIEIDKWKRIAKYSSIQILMTYCIVFAEFRSLIQDPFLVLTQISSKIEIFTK